MAKHRLQELKYQIQHAPAVLKAVAWYHGLPEREQKIFYWLGILVLIALIYSWFWLPAEKAKVNAEKSLKRELEVHQWMQNNAHKVKSNRRSSRASGDSLLAVINSTAKKHKVSLSRFEPDGENGVRIWLEGAAFDPVVGWVQELEQDQGVIISQVNADREAEGRASFRITFRR